MKRFASLALFLFAVTAALAAPAGDPWPRKKIIETGWDEPSTERLRLNLAEMEKTPFDGVVVGAVGKRDDGKGVSLRGAFVADAWQPEWFATCLTDLQAVKSSRLTDNFLILGANPGNVDWFDDAGWRNVVEHWRIAARLAKQGGCQGLLFDPEPYTAPFAQFRYSSQADREKHTFAEYYAQARQRGREVMQAVAAEFPDCLLYCYFMNSVNFPAAGQADARQALAGSAYGLYPPFIDGWLDAVPPTMTLIDGCESAYLWNSTTQFLQGAVLMKGDCQSLVSPENRAKYRAQVQVSFGLYLDAYRNPEGNRYFIDGLGGPRVDRLRQNCADALKCADQYVWVYGEQCRWWPTPNTRLTQTWEEGLPGCSAALRLAADPVAYARQQVQELTAAGKLVDLARNGDFTSETATDTTGAAVTWKESAPPAGWGMWQVDDSKGTLTWDRTVGHQAPGAAQVAQVKNGCVLQTLQPVQPGERYAVRASYRLQGRGTAWLRVRWQKPEGGWIAEQRDKLIYGAAQPGEWGELFGVAEVPEDVGRLVILLCIDGQMGPEDVAWFDDVHCWKLN